MKFSVIIPLYNKAPYIRKALESVLAQTYTDYEVIVVDDGSTDDSARIAEEYIREVKGTENSGAETTASRPSGVPENARGVLGCSSPLAFRLLKQKNAGVSAARNYGFSVSIGDYIAFLDADDWWEPTYLERMAQLIEDYPEAGLYACNYVYYKPSKTHVALNIPTGYINYPKAYYESGAMPVTSITAIMPRVVFDQMGGFPVGIKLGEDFLLWAKTAIHYPVAFLNEPLAYYNNDVPVNLRATRNLHHPNNHMLFNLEAYLQLLPKGKRVLASPKSSLKGKDFQSTPNPSLNEPTSNSSLKGREYNSFAKVFGAHTADSMQYDLLKKNAIENRKNPTEAESVLWDMLKGNQLGAHFRRQHIILDYIVDFICLDKGLIIELDGGYHNDPRQKEYDKARTAHLQRLGYTELRFKNEELLCNPDAVIRKITDTLEILPSLQGRAGDRLFSLPCREGTGVGSDWQALLDKLRVNGLLEYWLSKEYHDLAAKELAKVDWSKQPDSVKRIYKTPIWMLKVKRQVMKWGSAVKQVVIKVMR